MLRFTLIFCLLLSFVNHRSQNNYCYVVQTKASESGHTLLKPEASYTVVSYNGNIQTLYETEEYTEYRYYSIDTVFVYYWNKLLKKEVSGMGTGSEMKAIIKKEMNFKSKNILITQTGTEELAQGMLCKQAVLNYQNIILANKTNVEIKVWYSDQREVDADLRTAYIDHIWNEGPVIDSLRKLNGFILRQEVVVDGELISSFEVTDIIDITDNVLRTHYLAASRRKNKKLQQSISKINSYKKRKESIERLNRPSEFMNK